MTLILLGEAALRALALAVVVGGGLAVLRVRNPHVQLAVWRAVLLAALAMPILMQNVVLTLPANTLPAKTLAFTAPVEIAAPAASTDILSDTAPMLSDAPQDAAPADASFAWSSLVLGIYGLVTAALLLRLAVGAALTWRLWRAARPLRADWTAGGAVRVSPSLSAPVTIGSTILLPADHDTWSVEKRNAVLQHERAHIARGDFYILLLASAYRAVFWFSPLSWWLQDNLAELAELTSDAEAVRALQQRTSYADILLEFAATPRTAFMAVAMARPNTIRRRIEHILRDEALPARLTRVMHGVVALAIVPLALIAAVSLTEAPAVAAAPTSLTPPVAVDDLAPPTLLVPPVDVAPITLPDIVIDPSTPTATDRLRKQSERDAERAQERAERDVERDMEGNAWSAELSADIQERVAAAQERLAANLSRLQSVPALTRVSDRATQETRTVSAFDSVAFSLAGELRITIGATPSVTLEGDPDDLKAIRTEVRDGVLVIDSDDNDSRRNHIGRMTAHVTVPRLKDLKFSGSGHVYMAGLKGGETDIEFSGSGTIEASGSLDKLALKISGSGKADVPELVVADAEIKISGSGSVTIKPRQNLDVSISGSGKVRYAGNPHMNVHVSGSGSVVSLDDRSKVLR